MRAGGDVIALGRNIRRAMAEITANLPIGIEPVLVADQPATVDDAVNEFLRTLHPKHVPGEEAMVPLVMTSHGWIVLAIGAFLAVLLRQAPNRGILPSSRTRVVIAVACVVFLLFGDSSSSEGVG